MPTTLEIPNSPEALAERLRDPKFVNKLYADPANLQGLVLGYADIQNKDHPEINGTAGEQAQQVMMNFLKEHGASGPANRLNLDPFAKRAPKNTLYNSKAMGAEHDKLYGSISDLLIDGSGRTHISAEVSQKLLTLSNALSSIKPSDGGFLIPEILRSELLQVALEKAIVRGRARVIPMDSLSVPFPVVDSTSNVSSVFGGITGYWTEEGATLTDSQPKFARVKLEAHKLTLYTEIPNELIADSRPSLEALINQMFPEALAWFEDLAFLLGAGVGEPLGVLHTNNPATVNVARTASGNNIEWADCANMYARMLPSSLDRAVWLISPEALPDMLRMTVGDFPIMLNGFSGRPGATPLSLLGAPVIVTEKAGQTGARADISFVDFGMYLIGDRQAMSARQSEDFRFKNDVTAMRVVERVDGRPWLLSAITPYNGGDTLSPFVTLAV